VVPGCVPAHPRLPAVAAPDQRPPVRRPLPVAADTRRRRCPRWTPAVRTPSPGGRGSGRTTTLPAVSGRLRQPAVRRTPWSGQPPASRFRYRRGHRRRRASTAAAGGACMDGRPPATAMSLPCAGEPRPRRRAAVRPAPGRNPGRPADTAAVSGSADTWVPGQVGAAGRHRRSAARTADAACGNPQPAGGRHGGHPRPRHGHADTAAAACWTAGNGTVHCRLDVRPGTGPQGAASASTAMARPPDP
jgi:hypothetical protein